MRNPLHRHEWYVVLRNRWGMVELCRCREFQTTLIDYSKNQVVTVPGNLLASSTASRIFILCGNEEEFREAVKLLKRTDWQNLDNVVRLQSEAQLDVSYGPPPIIYMYGNVRENDLLDSPKVLRALNGWL